MQILFAKLVDKYLTDSPVLTQWIVPTGGQKRLTLMPNANLNYLEPKQRENVTAGNDLGIRLGPLKNNVKSHVNFS